MRGRIFSYTDGALWSDMSTYVQINIYDTNLKELRDKGVDIEHMLQHIGFRSLVMDVPILSSPVKISVEANAQVQRAKSSGGFLTGAWSYSNNNNIVDHGDVFVHDDMYPTKATSRIDYSSAVTDRKIKDRITPLTSTPLTSKHLISFRNFMSSPIRTISESDDTSFHSVAGCYQNEQCGGEEDTKHLLEDQPSVSLTENLIRSGSEEPPENTSHAAAVKISQGCQEGLVEVPAANGHVDVPLSYKHLSTHEENDTLTYVHTSSREVQSYSVTSLESETVEEVDVFNNNTIADNSFVSFSREVLLGLQSINATSSSFLKDGMLRTISGQPCYDDHSSSLEYEVSSSKDHKSDEGIKCVDANKLESQNNTLPTVEINTQSVKNTGTLSHGSAMEKDKNEHVAGNGLLPFSSLTLESQSRNEPLNSSLLSSYERFSIRPNVLRKEPSASEQSVRRKRARAVSKDYRKDTTESVEECADNDKNGCRCSVAESNEKNKLFHCHIPNCGKDIIWRPRYGKNRLVDHVRTHWAKAVKKCKICEFKASSYRKIHHHHKKAHKNMPYMGAVSTETKEDLDELLMFWKQCFPDTALW